MHPLVVTLLLDDVAQQRFDAERSRLFPPGRTVVGAHVTLFHALPGEHLETVRGELTDAVALEGFAVEVTGLRSLGRGVAYVLESAPLQRLHARLADAWRPWLTPQDAQPYRPHVTVQNKADPATARATLAELQSAFRPTTIRAEGLRLWHYVGGPWEDAGTFPFRG